jgi:hypothetical protein
MAAHLLQPPCSLSAPDPDDGTSSTTFLYSLSAPEPDDGTSVTTYL